MMCRRANSENSDSNHTVASPASLLLVAKKDNRSYLLSFVKDGHCSYNQKSPCSCLLTETERNVKSNQHIRQNLTWNVSTLNGKMSLIDSLALDIILLCNIRISLDKFSSLTPLYISLISAILTGSGGQNTTFTCKTHSYDLLFTHL